MKNLLIPWWRWNVMVAFFLLFLVGALGIIGVSGLNRSYELLPAAAAMATMAAMMVVILNQRRKDDIDRSKFYLESTLKSFEQAVDMLRDGNDRVRWIAGARMLARAQHVAQSVSEPEHLDVLEVNKEELRFKLAEILGYKVEAKRGAFFYGASNETDINEAAAASTRSIEIEGHIVGQLTSIPEDVLFTIYRFAEFPEDYVEPMVRGHFRGRAWDFMPSRYPGMYEYLRHRDQYHSAGGTLHPRPEAPDRRDD